MKYIISENKLEQLKTNFLNSYIENNVRKFDSFILVSNDVENDSEIVEPHFEYDYYDGRLFVNKDIRDNFTNIFGYSKEKSNDFFKKWFEEYFLVEVAFVD
jgi:hypothetical protein